MTNIIGNGKVSTNLSIDRIDCNVGYTVDNIQLVCNSVNTMRNNLSIKDFITFCQNIINYQEGREL